MAAIPEIDLARDAQHPQWSGLVVVTANKVQGHENKICFFDGTVAANLEGRVGFCADRHRGRHRVAVYTTRLEQALIMLMEAAAVTQSNNKKEAVEPSGEVAPEDKLLAWFEDNGRVIQEDVFSLVTSIVPQITSSNYADLLCQDDPRLQDNGNSDITSSQNNNNDHIDQPLPTLPPTGQVTFILAPSLERDQLAVKVNALIRSNSEPLTPVRRYHSPLQDVFTELKNVGNITMEWFQFANELGKDKSLSLLDRLCDLIQELGGTSSDLTSTTPTSLTAGLPPAVLQPSVPSVPSPPMSSAWDTTPQDSLPSYYKDSHGQSGW
ncbi:hypothetical protein VTL71DRAFT_15712 [Oculimacula yallundae]|uniref:Uncharacterized protein n=1 Tax=Oculimacula yallundae TaxID=86028 RepID=A0ABR4CHZ0_9HELO